MVIGLRGYEDLLEPIEEEILELGVIWDKGTLRFGRLEIAAPAPAEISLHAAFFVIDQFEEFQILETEEQQESLRRFLNALNVDPIEGVTFLFAFRSEYEGMIDSRGWPERLLHIKARSMR